MNALRDRLRPASGSEGFTLVEVVVAMFIFTLVLTGSLYSMIMVLQVTRDNRSSQVASNLAAEEIDLSRDIDDLFDLVDGTRIVEVNGDVFTISRDTNWVSDVGDIQCATGGGALRYKRVNITVSWANMRDGAVPVQSDTVIDSRNRINDPTLGTILVSARNASGTGSSGVTVTAVPTDVAGNTAVNLAEAPAATDSEGCSYILKVKPGKYDVKVEKTNFVDIDQKTSSTVTGVDVVAGASAGVGFAYDLAGTLNLDFSGVAAGNVKLPDTLDLSFMNSNRNYITTRPSSNALKLFPWESGYQILAGKYVAPTGSGATANPGCVSVDPQAWPTAGSGSNTITGRRGDAVGGPGTDSGPVAMAAVQVPATSNTVITAVSAVAPASTGDPGCAQGMTYVFTLSGSNVSSNKATIALPYGSWRLYSKTNTILGQLGGLLGLGGIIVQPGVGATVTGDVLTLDPRKVQP